MQNLYFAGSSLAKLLILREGERGEVRQQNASAILPKSEWLTNSEKRFGEERKAKSVSG